MDGLVRANYNLTTRGCSHISFGCLCIIVNLRQSRVGFQSEVNARCQVARQAGIAARKWQCPEVWILKKHPVNQNYESNTLLPLSLPF